MTTSTSETNNAPTANPASGTAGFLKRLLLAFIKVALALLFLAILAAGVFLGYRELNRSFDSVVVRIERNTRRIEETETEIGVLEEQNYAQKVQIGDLELALADRDQQIATLEQALDTEVSRQDRQLASLGEEIATLDERAGALGEETAQLNAGLLALQEDLIANGQDIDQLGGTVDGLAERLGGLESQAAELQTRVDELANEELAGWRRAVAFFRIWEMIGRARLRLVEDNLGLALADIELAQAAIDDYLAGAQATEDPFAEQLTAIRERLVLASTYLPDLPLAASRDLETAWEALDAIVAQALLNPAAASTPEETTP